MRRRHRSLLRVNKRLVRTTMPVVFRAHDGRFRDCAARKAGNKMECHVGACGYASGGHVVPGVYPARDVVSQYVGTEAAHPRECFVVCSSGLPVEDARTREDGSACADGAHELDTLVHRDYPIEEFLHRDQVGRH